MTEITPGLGMSAYMLGRRIAGQRQRKPTAYLYNGVNLPPLPAMKEAFYFIGLRAGVYHVYSYSSIKTVRSDGTMAVLAYTDSYTLNGDKWEENRTGALNFTPIWANHNILYSDSAEGVGGTVFLSASEPVPIYE